jgi:ACR3 family arsenite transporter
MILNARYARVDWFHHVYKPIIGKIAIIALLTTLVVLCSLNGTVLIQHPEEMLLVSIPLLVGFAIVVGINLLVTRLTGLRYKEGSSQSLLAHRGISRSRLLRPLVYMA